MKFQFTNQDKQNLLLLTSVGLVFRLLLIYFFPAAFGSDCIGRLYLKEHLFIGHWLPFTQALVLLGTKAGFGYEGIRMIFAVFGTAASATFYLLARQLVASGFALFAALTFSLNSLVVSLSIMPFQDVISVGFLSLALVLFFKDGLYFKSKSGSLVLGLACLTRYESWFVLLLLFIWKISAGKPHGQLPSFSKILMAGFYFGWAPALWLLVSKTQLGQWNAFLFDTADSNFYGWHPHFDLIWMAGFAKNMLYWLVRFGLPLVFFIPLGFRGLHKKELPPSLKILFPIVGITLLFFFVIIGKDFQTVNRFAVLPLTAGLLVGTIGLEDFIQRVKMKWLLADIGRNTKMLKLAAAIALLTVGSLTIFSLNRINREPIHQVPHKIAKFLDENLKAEESALVVAGRVPDLTDFAPMHYQRILAQSKLDRSQVFSSGLLNFSSEEEVQNLAKEKNVKFVVQFTDFVPFQESDKVVILLLESPPPGTEVVFKTELALIFRITNWQNEPEVSN